MDAEESGEFQDWEVLHNSDVSVLVNSLDSVDNTKILIRSDYFSLHNHPNNNNNNNNNNNPSTVRDESNHCKFNGENELGIVENDEAQLDHNGIGEILDESENLRGFWSDCSGKEPILGKVGDLGESDCKFSGFGGKNELGIVENDETQLVHDGIGEIVTKSENSGEFSCDSSGIEPVLSEIGDLEESDCKISGFGGKNELGIVENDEAQLVHDGIGEIVAEGENSGDLFCDCRGIEPISSKIGDLGESDCKFSGFGDENELGIVGNVETQLVHARIGEIVVESENFGEFRSHCSRTEPISSKTGDLGEIAEMAKPEKEMDISVEEKSKQSNENESVAIKATKQGGEEEKRRMVWWKLPLDLLRYCAIRVSPVWTVSVAAAVLGFVILGRRLHKMKRKSRSLRLKVTVDDKKASQVMSKAERLNEAFSVVKRVPVIRPSLPASGVAPWPVMILR